MFVFWKVLRLLPKFNSSFSKPPHNRRLSTTQILIRVLNKILTSQGRRFPGSNLKRAGLAVSFIPTYKQTDFRLWAATLACIHTEGLPVSNRVTYRQQIKEAVHLLCTTYRLQRDTDWDRKTFQKQRHRQHYYRSEYRYVNPLLKITPCGAPSCDPDNEGNDAQGPRRAQCHRACPIHRQQHDCLRNDEPTIFLRKDNILCQNVCDDSSIFDRSRLKIVSSLRRPPASGIAGQHAWLSTGVPRHPDRTSVSWCPVDNAVLQTASTRTGRDKGCQPHTTMY